MTHPSTISQRLPALLHLAHEGLCLAPKYLPPWAEDRQFLVSYLAYSGFLNEVNLSTVKAHYAKMLDGTWYTLVRFGVPTPPVPDRLTKPNAPVPSSMTMASA